MQNGIIIPTKVRMIVMAMMVCSLTGTSFTGSYTFGADKTPKLVSCRAVYEKGNSVYHVNYKISNPAGMNIRIWVSYDDGSYGQAGTYSDELIDDGVDRSQQRESVVRSLNIKCTDGNTGKIMWETACAVGFSER